MRLVKDEDFLEINEWRFLHEAPPISRDMYPPTGLIEPGVAAGWINFTQTKMALMENFVANPQSDAKKREDAIMTIIESLEKMAYTCGVKWIVAVTSHPKIEKYIYKAKGQRLPGKVFGKELIWG